MDIGNQRRHDRHDRIAVSSFARPPRNLMTFAGMTELETMVEDVAADESVLVLVIASDTPGYFMGPRP